MSDFIKNLLALIIICAITLLITVIYIGMLRLHVSGEGFFYWWVIITVIFFVIFGYSG